MRRLERVVLLCHALHGAPEERQLGDPDARLRRGGFTPRLRSRLLRRERLRRAPLALRLGARAFPVEPLVTGAPGRHGRVRRPVRRRPGRGRLAGHVRRRDEDAVARHRSVLRVLAEPDRGRVLGRASRSAAVAESGSVPVDNTARSGVRQTRRVRERVAFRRVAADR